MDSLHSHLNSAEGSKCLNFTLSIFSVLERNTVKCLRGSFIENAMFNVNELGWGHTFFPYRASTETNTGLEEK